MLARKIDAQRWEAHNEAAKHRGAWVDPAGGTVKGGEQTERWYKQAEQAGVLSRSLPHPKRQMAFPRRGREN
jgi:hypothetical protein